jgi:predicted MFS family arabinose efflux permease
MATGGLALMVFGFTNAATHSWSAPLTIGSIVGSVALLTAFVLWETYGTEHPLLPMRIVLDRNRGGAFLSFLLATLGLFGVFLFLTYYLQDVLGYSPLKAGFAFLPFPIGIIISATIASKTLPRMGPRPLAVTGFALGTVGLFLLTQLSPTSSYPLHLVLPMLLISFGMGQVFVPMSSTALLGVPAHDAGVASAMVNTMQQVGGSLGVAFLNTVATTATAHYALAHSGAVRAATTHGFTTAFGYSAAVFAAATILVAVMIRAKRDDVTPPQPQPVTDGELEALAVPAF